MASSPRRANDTVLVLVRDGAVPKEIARTSRMSRGTVWRNGAVLWPELQARGFTSSLRVVTEWATRRRRSERQDESSLLRTPSARTLARLMTAGLAMLVTMKPTRG